MAGWYTRGPDGRGRDRYGHYESDNPWLISTFVRGLAQQIIREILYEYRDQISEELKDKLSTALHVWAESIYRRAREDLGESGDLQKMHAKMADGVHQAIQEAFEASGIGQKRPSYRYNDKGKMRRYANKRLKKAIADKRLVHSDLRGVAFPNTKLLDKAAPQWYRLNFGAAPAKTNLYRHSALRFMRMRSKTKIHFSRSKFPPSAAFSVPDSVKARGVWLATPHAKTPADLISQVGKGLTTRRSVRPHGLLYLVPKKGHRRLGFEKRLSKGIVGARFLDAGAEYLNKNYGNELTKMFRKWHNNASRDARKALQQLDREYDARSRATKRKPKIVVKEKVVPRTPSQWKMAGRPMSNMPAKVRFGFIYSNQTPGWVRRSWTARYELPPPSDMV